MRTHATAATWREGLARIFEPGDSHFFHAFNRNKRSVTLDLNTDEGKALFHQLVGTADAVVSNLRGDVPEKLGLTYASLKTHNPKVVCAHLSAYGRGCTSELAWLRLSNAGGVWILLADRRGGRSAYSHGFVNRRPYDRSRTRIRDANRANRRAGKPASAATLMSVSLTCRCTTCATWRTGISTAT